MTLDLVLSHDPVTMPTSPRDHLHGNKLEDSPKRELYLEDTYPRNEKAEWCYQRSPRLRLTIEVTAEIYHGRHDLGAPETIITLSTVGNNSQERNICKVLLDRHPRRWNATTLSYNAFTTEPYTRDSQRSLKWTESSGFSGLPRPPLLLSTLSQRKTRKRTKRSWGTKRKMGRPWTMRCHRSRHSHGSTIWYS
jgi:hypothetical protein